MEAKKICPSKFFKCCPKYPIGCELASQTIVKKSGLPNFQQMRQSDTHSLLRKKSLRVLQHFPKDEFGEGNQSMRNDKSQVHNSQKGARFCRNLNGPLPQARKSNIGSLIMTKQQNNDLSRQFVRQSKNPGTPHRGSMRTLHSERYSPLCGNPIQSSSTMNSRPSAFTPKQQPPKPHSRWSTNPQQTSNKNPWPTPSDTVQQPNKKQGESMVLNCQGLRLKLGQSICTISSEKVGTEFDCRLQQSSIFLDFFNPNESRLEMFKKL